jgi:hypothetical protein
MIRGTQRKVAGEVAGEIDPDGYRVIEIDGVYYRANDLAWLYVYGTFPVNGTYHLNGNRDDNRIANLRENLSPQSN